MWAMKLLGPFSSPSVETYASRRYQSGLKSWRRWVRWRLLPVFGPVFVGAMAWGIVERHNAAFLAGFIAGAAGAMFMGLREFAPPYVENWGLGSEGELKTHKVLAALEWTLVDDVGTGRGNYDHIVVGPPGVFVIETKNLRGTAAIRNGAVSLRRRHDPARDQRLTGLQRSVLGASKRVSDVIRERTGQRKWVQAIVVFWNAFPEGIVEADRVIYVHGSQLKDYLETLPPRLNQESQTEIGRVLHELKQGGE
jgi:hypothetical protein